MNHARVHELAARLLDEVLPAHRNNRRAATQDLDHLLPSLVRGVGARPRHFDPLAFLGGEQGLVHLAPLPVLEALLHGDQVILRVYWVLVAVDHLVLQSCDAVDGVGAQG